MAKGRTGRSAADLLGDWRAAERDAVSAKKARSVADRALAAAQAASEAAAESAAAAKAAVEASRRASLAAQAARKVAAELSASAAADAKTAEGDKATANHHVTHTEEAETSARDRFHDAEAKGFPREET